MWLRLGNSGALLSTQLSNLQEDIIDLENLNKSIKLYFFKLWFVTIILPGQALHIGTPNNFEKHN
jgi:hypothetical protein